MQEVVKNALFTRQDISRLVGLSDSTLNFWMRAGLLVPSEGGQGRGQHRRFDYVEVNIAAILDKLASFGLRGQELRDISDRFRDAYRWIEALHLTDGEHEAMFTLAIDRERYLRLGYYEELVPLDSRADLANTFPHSDLPGRRAWHLSWDEVVASWRKSHDASNYSDRAVQMSEKLDPREYLNNSFFARTVTDIPVKTYDAQPYAFYKNSDGRWVMVADPAKAASEAGVFIGMDIDSILYQVWSGRA